MVTSSMTETSPLHTYLFSPSSSMVPWKFLNAGTCCTKKFLLHRHFLNETVIQKCSSVKELCSQTCSWMRRSVSHRHASTCLCNRSTHGRICPTDRFSSGGTSLITLRFFSHGICSSSSHTSEWIWIYSTMQLVHDWLYLCWTTHTSSCMKGSVTQTSSCMKGSVTQFHTWRNLLHRQVEKWIHYLS